MNKLVGLLLVSCLLLACKKKSDAQEDLVILAMTTGQWKITSFSEGVPARFTGSDWV
jgi:hypothetical protein